MSQLLTNLTLNPGEGGQAMDSRVGSNTKTKKTKDSQQPQREGNRDGHLLHPLQGQLPDLREWQAQGQDVGEDVDGAVGDADGLGADAPARDPGGKQLGDGVAVERVEEAEDERGEEDDGEDGGGGRAEVGHDLEDAVVHEQYRCFGCHHDPLVQDLHYEVQLVGRRDEAGVDSLDVHAEPQVEEDAGDGDFGGISHLCGKRKCTTAVSAPVLQNSHREDPPFSSSIYHPDDERCKNGPGFSLTRAKIIK